MYFEDVGKIGWPRDLASFGISQQIMVAVCLEMMSIAGSFTCEA